MLQDNRSELAGMIGQFDSATQRALHSLAELQAVSKKITDALQLKIDKANFLADDLAFLIEKSSKLVAQLEQMKKIQQPVAVQPKPDAKSFFEAQKPSSPSPSTIKPTSTVSSTSLEAVLQRLSSQTASPPPGPSPEIKPAVRTNAERELLEALKIGR